MKMLASIEASLDQEKGKTRQNRNLFFTSHLVAMLRSGTSGIRNTGYNYPNVYKWTRTLPTGLFDYDKVFFPCNIQDEHWFLLVVDNKEKTVSLYDPIHARRPDYLNDGRKYVYDEYERSNTAEIPCEYEKMICAVPSQDRQMVVVVAFTRAYMPTGYLRALDSKQFIRSMGYFNTECT
jgi:Ulp1 family protease